MGIVGALASILASVLIPAPERQVDPTVEIRELKAEPAAMHDELTATRRLLDGGARASGGPASL